jgi:hypothetical protein
MATEEAASHVEDAEHAADLVQKELLSNPSMTREEFGQRVRQAAQMMRKKYENMRTEKAGFGKVLENAPAQPDIKTGGIQKSIDAALEDVRNPELQSVMTRIKGLLRNSPEEAPDKHLENIFRMYEVGQETAETAGKETSALNLRQADSLRKYLDDIISRRRFEDKAVSKETVVNISRVRQALVDAAGSKHPDYSKALKTYREMSRNLDIVSGKGDLAPMLQEDMAGNYAKAEGEIVRSMLTRAQNGSPVMRRLIAESPELKEAARKYFADDLFGKGTVPTDASLRIWLKNNSGALKQAGLYEDFSSMQQAQASSKEAIAAAKESLKRAKGEETAAGRAEREANAEASRAGRVSVKSASRLEDALKAPTVEKQVAQFSNRALKQQGELGKRATQAATETEKATARAKKFKTFQTQLETLEPKKVPGELRKLADELVKDDHISQAQYKELLEKANAAENAFKTTQTRQRWLKGVAATLGVGAATEVGFHVMSGGKP